MPTYAGLLLLLALTCVLLAVPYAAARLVAFSRRPMTVPAHTGGEPSAEHPLSRYHPRWYAMSLVLLAFDLEMLFMYPWVLVVADVGVKAVVEMFVFLAMLAVGVLYAWREGVFRWV